MSYATLVVGFALSSLNRKMMSETFVAVSVSAVTEVRLVVPGATSTS